MAAGALTGVLRATPTGGMAGPAGMGGLYRGALTTGCELPQLLQPDGAGATMGGAPCQPGGGAGGMGSFREWAHPAMNVVPINSPQVERRNMFHLSNITCSGKNCR